MTFAEKMKLRTKQFALDVVVFCRSLKTYPETRVIQNQLIKSSTSVAANYRAACRARSKKEWISKISIVVEEIDEANFWLDFIKSLELSEENKELTRLINESDYILKILAQSRRTAKNNNQQTREPFVPYINVEFSNEEE